MSQLLRIRLGFVAAALGTIAVGLVVHSGAIVLAPRPRDVLGDGLWAMMIAWWIGALAPGKRLDRRAALALVVCWAVEFSQLYSVPVLDAVRRTTAGQLVLGSGFDPRDLVAYTVGVLVALVLETAMLRPVFTKKLP